MRGLGDAEGPKSGGSLKAERERDPARFAQEISNIRAALQDYLDFASLRQAAREVGMSPTGLSQFLSGSEPYMPTVNKLRTWYADHLRRDGATADGA